MRTHRLFSLFVAAILLASATAGARAQERPVRAPATIWLKSGAIVPAAQAAQSADELAETQRLGGRTGSFIVQFAGPVEQAWKDKAAALGAELLEYLPDYAFRVRTSPAVAAQLRALPEVAWVGVYRSAYKFSPAEVSASPALYRVRTDRGTAAGVAAELAAAGVAVLGGDGDTLLVGADASQVAAVSRSIDVAWIEPYELIETHNEYGGSTIIGAATARARTVGGQPLDGSSQIAAVADTGLGGGTAATAHPDIPAGRVVSVFNWPGVTDSCFQTIVNDGAVDVSSGHGTHVAGSVLSDGGSAGEGIGVAPAARLVFQATENYVITSNLCKNFYGLQNGYYLTGLPTDLNQLFQQAYAAGARIHANSWGSASAGDYTANSAAADQFIWNNRDMTITFSAGNEGADANANGVVDNDSIGSPATAKNVITIGASENDRQGNYQCDTALTYTSRDTSYQSGQTCGSMGGQNLLGTPGQRWPADFPANPIASDPTAGNAEQMAAFSSRGPTDDSRIKPDVVAPGTWILSTYSGQYREGYGAATNPQDGSFQSDGWGMPRNGLYKYFGGTSMSNPIAAGAATLVRDFYQKGYSQSASAALVKATLINSAVDILDENNDGVSDNDFPIPNVHEGWGRINLDNATDGTAVWTDNTASLATGASAASSYSVAGGQPLKVTLVWSDYPSTAAASINLVNNLNLTVSGPGGVSYIGNVFAGGWSASGGTADARNNVENVYVQAPAAGTWTVTVTGANVPNGPQPFALVVDGAQVAPPPPPPAAPTGLTATAASPSQINLSWADNATNEDAYSVERCQGAGCTSFSPIATLAANTTSYQSTGLTASASYTFRVRASNAGGASAYSNEASATTLAGPVTLGPLSPSANAAVTASAGDNNGFQTSPNNAHANDGAFAVDTNSGSNTNTSCTNAGKDKHVYQGYNITVPAGATVNGITVRLDARADGTAGAPRMCVQLSWDGGVSWTAAQTTATLTTSEATYTLGGSANTWGRTWTSAEVNNLRVRVINVASNAQRDFSLDWVAVSVTYQ